MHNILRINQSPAFPHRLAREQTLSRHFHGDINFIDWMLPDTPIDLSVSLNKKLHETQALVAEVDCNNDVIIAHLAIAVKLGANTIALVNYPHTEQRVRILVPQFDVLDTLIGYVELKGIVTVTEQANIRLIS